MARVLVIKPSSLGDIIHSAEGVQRLSRSTPDCHVTWVVNAGLEDFVREFPGVDSVVPFPREKFRARRILGSFPAAMSFARRLRRGCDVAIDLQGLQRSSLMGRVSGARERFGPSDAREMATLHYTHEVVVPGVLTHAIDRTVHVVKEACRVSRHLHEMPELDREKSDFRLPVPDPSREKVDEILGDDGRAILVLCPGSRWETKLWPAARWASFLQLLQESHPELRPVVVGAAGEEGLVDEMSAAGASGVESLVGRVSIWVCGALMERAAGVVTLDSAPLHLALAVGAPTVSLFGPTDPAKVGPRGEGHRVLRRGLDCLACYERKCRLQERICVPETTAAEVLAALEDVLRATPPPESSE